MLSSLPRCSRVVARFPMRLRDAIAISPGMPLLLEPVAAVGYPPTHVSDRDCGNQGPPDRKAEVGEEAEQDEENPEDFALHFRILLPSRLSFQVTNV